MNEMGKENTGHEQKEDEPVSASIVQMPAHYFR
jgi:hypothetical protein